LPLPLNIVVGGVSLNYREFRTLAVGDALAPDELDITKARLEYRGQRLINIKIEGHKVVVTGVSDQKENNLAINSDVEPKDSETEDEIKQSQALVTNFDEIELPLKFSVGQKVMSLARLKALVVGQVIEIEHPDTDQVSVVCHGQTVALGRLIDLGGRMGVQITKINQNNG
jgi:type III secretion system YscQ/HrcQ family protein